MGLDAPFKRTVRPFIMGGYQPSNGSMAFVRMQSFAESPRSYTRGFELLQREIRELFDFIEPDDINLDAHSTQIGRLLAGVCFEIESNLKAILRENGYKKAANWNMSDYSKIDETHHLSTYEVLFPEWTGSKRVVKPFEAWKNGKSGLDWYNAYHAYKHDRSINARQASFQNLLHAWAGLFALLSSQFFTEDFSVDAKVIGFADDFDPGGFNHGIGGYLRARFPSDWADDHMYDFHLTKDLWSDPKFVKSNSY